MCQELTVSVASDLEEAEVELDHNPLEPCSINVDEFSSEQEWTLSSRVHIWRKTTKKVSNNVALCFPVMCVAARAARKPQFFIWNIVVIMVSIAFSKNIL